MLANETAMGAYNDDQLYEALRQHLPTMLYPQRFHPQRFTHYASPTTLYPQRFTHNATTLLSRNATSSPTTPAYISILSFISFHFKILHFSSDLFLTHLPPLPNRMSEYDTPLGTTEDGW
jgi:hypothetical protein